MARPSTRADSLARDDSIWFPRSRSAAARSPCTTGANVANNPFKPTPLRGEAFLLRQASRSTHLRKVPKHVHAMCRISRVVSLWGAM